MWPLFPRYMLDSSYIHQPCVVILQFFFTFHPVCLLSDASSLPRLVRSVGACHHYMILSFAEAATTVPSQAPSHPHTPCHAQPPTTCTCPRRDDATTCTPFALAFRADKSPPYSHACTAHSQRPADRYHHQVAVTFARRPGVIATATGRAPIAMGAEADKQVKVGSSCSIAGVPRFERLSVDQSTRI